LAIGAVPTLALFLVLASSGCVSTTVDSEAELSRAEFGLPFPYLEAQLSLSPPSFPYSARWNPWEHPAQVHVRPLLASFAVVVAALFLVPVAIAIYLRATAPPEVPRPPPWEGTTLVRRTRGGRDPG
jgi:hypothetical protein